MASGIVEKNAETRPSMRIQLLTAPWCQACHGILPVVTKIALEEKTNLEVVDVEQHPEEGEGVTQLPTLRAVKDGIEMAKASSITAQSIRDFFRTMRMNIA